MPKNRVIDSAFTWGADAPPNIPWHKTLIYEMHVKGFTRCHPDVPAHLRGTYAGLSTAPVIEYLTRLGVTSIELMPVHSFVDDRQLVDRGLRNYWGYNSIGFFALEPRYLATNSIREFKTMVKTCLLYTSQEVAGRSTARAAARAHRPKLLRENPIAESVSPARLNRQSGAWTR